MLFHVDMINLAKQAKRDAEKSFETPQSTTNPSQTLIPMYKLALLPLSHLQDSHNL